MKEIKSTSTSVNIMFTDVEFDSTMLYSISDEFERDSRRYNRAFCEESEVSGE